MTSHELGRLLLDGVDIPVWFQDNESGWRQVEAVGLEADTVLLYELDPNRVMPPGNPMPLTDFGKRFVPAMVSETNPSSWLDIMREVGPEAVE
jgi:hypothetical protein